MAKLPNFGASACVCVRVRVRHYTSLSRACAVVMRPLSRLLLLEEEIK